MVVAGDQQQLTITLTKDEVVRPVGRCGAGGEVEHGWRLSGAGSTCCSPWTRGACPAHNRWVGSKLQL